MAENNTISQTISYLRFPLTVAVVYIHFNISRKGISVHGINYGINNPDWYIYLINLISYVFASIAVPLFYFISGYLFFRQKEFNIGVYKEKLCSRIKTLLVPFFLWNLIAITLQTIRLIPFFSSLFPGAYKTEIHLSLIRIFNTFFNNTLQNGILVSPIGYTMTEIINEPYPIDIPLWYIRDLIVMVIVSPLIYWIIKKCNVLYIIVLGVIWILKSFFLPQGGYIAMLITALFFFSWGGFHGINEIDFVKEMQKYKYMLLLYIPIAISDTLTVFTNYNTYIHNIGILFGVVAVINIAVHRMKSGYVKVNNLLLNSTFFVYALHKLIIDDVAKIFFSLSHLPDNTYVMLFFYVVIPIITILICIGLYKSLYHISPVTCNLLTGGR